MKLPSSSPSNPAPAPARRSIAAAAVLLGFTAWLAAALPVAAQSLWRDETGAALVSDKRAHAVGDILTILVQESNSAQKDNSTSTSKKTGLDAKIATMLYSPAAGGFLANKGEMPAIKFDASHTFDGGGKINNSEKITARIAVRVIDVLPNGNLVIEGSKKTAFAGETQDAVLRGVVRQEDITPANTIFSYNVSDASIQYVSKGAVSNAQRKGWFTKIWEFVTPF